LQDLSIGPEKILAWNSVGTLGYLAINECMNIKELLFKLIIKYIKI
jgi:hypothetical protein